MKKYIFALVFLFLALFFQQSFFGRFTFFSAPLNIIFISIFLVDYLFYKEERFCLFFNGLAGILLDIFSSSYLGIYFFVFILIYFLIQKLNLYFERASLFSFLVIFLVSFFFYKYLYLFIDQLSSIFLEKKINFYFNFGFREFLIESLFNFIISLPFLFILKKRANHHAKLV